MSCSVQSDTRRHAFTLVELLVVVTVILLLIGLGYPALQKAIAKAHQGACMSNLRQMFIAASLYAADNNDHVIPGSTGESPDTTFWNTILLDYYQTETNTTEVRKKLTCPAWKSTTKTSSWNWGYAANVTPGYPESNATTLITNTSGNPFRLTTIRFPSKRIYFACGNDWHIRYGNWEKMAAFDRHGTGKCNVVFFDGHVESLHPIGVETAETDPEHFENYPSETPTP